MLYAKGGFEQLIDFWVSIFRLANSSVNSLGSCFLFVHYLGKLSCLHIRFARYLVKLSCLRFRFASVVTHFSDFELLNSSQLLSVLTSRSFLSWCQSQSFTSPFQVWLRRFPSSVSRSPVSADRFQLFVWKSFRRDFEDKRASLSPTSGFPVCI